MTRLRRPVMGFVTLGLCLSAAATHGQPATPPGPFQAYRLEAKPLPPDALAKMGQLKKAEQKTGGPQAAANKQLFKQAAQWVAYRATYDQYYVTPDSGELRPRQYDQSFDNVLADLDSLVLVPTPEALRTPDVKLTTDHADYIREFGAALNEAVVEVLNKAGVNKDTAPIRVNAGRVLASAARSGAPAHAKTVTALLTDKFYVVNNKPVATPPDVLVHALRAAEGLLAAYDPVAYRDLIPERVARHSIRGDDLDGLVRALDLMVLNNPPVADKAFRPGVVSTPATPLVKKDAAGKAPVPDPAAARLEATALSPEQVAVVRYYRKHAVQALAKYRFDALVDPNTNELSSVRPAWTLAKVAASDPAISPPPSPTEAGEAALGLCGILPSQEVNVSTLAYAIGSGLRSLYVVRVPDEGKKLAQWRVYAARTGAAMAALKQAAARNVRLKPIQPAVDELTGLVMADVVTPLDRDQPNQISVDRLGTWVGRNTPKPLTLYTNSTQFVITPPFGGR